MIRPRYLLSMAALIAVFVMPGAAHAEIVYQQLDQSSTLSASVAFSDSPAFTVSTTTTLKSAMLYWGSPSSGEMQLAVMNTTFTLSYCTFQTPNFTGSHPIAGVIVTLATSSECDIAPGDYALRMIKNSGLNPFTTYGTAGGNPFAILSTKDDLNPYLEGLTRIISMTPEEGTTTGTSVTFDLHIYINPNDLSFINGIQLFYQNIDQNQVLAGIPGLTKSEVLVLAQATTSGDIYFHAVRDLPDGNYRVQGKIERTLVGLVKNPFDDVNETQNHQYIVNESTYIGHLNQLGFKELNGILASTTATSTEASGLNCSPTTFHIVPCLAFLFIPGGAQLDETMSSFRSGIATRMPWGYFYRMYGIFTTTSTTSLPAFVATIPIGPPSNLSTTSLSFDMNDMIAGGGQLAASITDGRGHTIRDITEPTIRLVIALMVIIIIWHDITAQAHHPKMQRTRK